MYSIVDILTFIRKFCIVSHNMKYNKVYRVTNQKMNVNWDHMITPKHCNVRQNEYSVYANAVPTI